MKKIFYQIMGLCSILGVATACNEDPEYFTLDEQPDEMHIVASTDKLVLDKGKEDETAITFTWDAASSPVNETDLVTYSLRLYATANKSANNTDFYELDTDRKKSFTHDELNAIIGTWVLPGQEVKVTAQVVCTVHNADKYIKPESSTVEFTVSGYEKYPTYIYIHMTDNEGKVSTQRLGQRSMGTGIYEGTFDVTPCTYHFITVAGGDYPAYGNSGDDLHMVYLNEGEITEFTNTETGRRTFIVMSGKGRVLIHGEYAPILGRICMDQFMVDVSHIKEAAIGDTVTIFGKDGEKNIPVEEIAEKSHSFNYEFVCSITNRVPRKYLGE